MRRPGFMLFCCALSTAAGAVGEMDVTYRVKVDNLGPAAVLFKLDGANPCTAPPQGSCDWDIAYGSHRLDAYIGGKRYSRDFELSDESDFLVHCTFDGTKFGGDSC